MNRIAVESTTLATVGYDDASSILQLEFRSGANYQYFEVPATAYQGLLDAPSKGSYFNQSIRGHFRYHLILGTDARRDESLRSEGAR
jgi:KTSC domain-containing protein